MTARQLPPGGCIRPTDAARRLALTMAEFRAKRADLERRGFPLADPTTGNYYLPDIDQWLKDESVYARNSQATRLTPAAAALDARTVDIANRMRGI